ncbi:hypothetical protein [Nevskia ramosa]|uniref:hypothetical protein n=1 Tax=Nevskia ramosa TaxID=64002 RepID=UPI0023555A94|nr:hypothetical protein [Nevskia ramosa]
MNDTHSRLLSVPPPPQPPASRLKQLLPGLLALLIAVVLIAGCVLIIKRISAGSGAPEIVVVDVSKIVNAQRAAIGDDPVDGRLASLRASKTADQVIRQIAGPNTIVLVKQAIVAADEGLIRDITMDVIRELSLPVDAKDTLTLPPLTGHAYTEQGQTLLKAEKEKNAAAVGELKALEAQSQKETLIP